ncbi:hypothetical protein ACP70R_003769 [Stipagrostis hirtigluma subsp. patula]
MALLVLERHCIGVVAASVTSDTGAGAWSPSMRIYGASPLIFDLPESDG